MDISSLVSSIMPTQIAQQLDVTMTTKSLDLAKEQSQATLDMLPKPTPAQTITPHLGQHIDLFG